MYRIINLKKHGNGNFIFDLTLDTVTITNFKLIRENNMDFFVELPKNVEITKAELSYLSNKVLNILEIEYTTFQCEDCNHIVQANITNGLDILYCEKCDYEYWYSNKKIDKQAANIWKSASHKRSARKAET